MNVLTVSLLSKIYGSGDTAVHAVDRVSFSVRQGEIVLIMGPSGSGKTTLLSMIGGLLSPTGGSINVNGKALEKASSSSLATFRLKEIGFVFQSFNILQHLTALENVQYVGELAGMPSGKARDKAIALMKKLHLENRMSALPSQLSGGQQQRVSIARALMNDPKMILADEPTGNLDSRSGHEVMMLFHNIAKEQKRSVIIVSHDERIKDSADRVLWIEDGRLSAVRPEPERLQKDPICGMRIDPKYAPFKLKQRHRQTVVFCSEDCYSKFQRSSLRKISG